MKMFIYILDLNSLTAFYMEDNTLKEEIEQTKDKLKLLRQQNKRPKLSLINSETSGIKIGTKSDGIKYSVRENRDRIFFPEEWKKFYDCLKPNQLFTFAFLINTGCRINEAINVKIKDLDDLNNKRMVFRVTKVRAKLGEKISKPRYIKLSTQFAKKLKEHIKDKSKEEHIRIISQPAAWLAMRKALEKANIKDYNMFAIHSIRKTTENWLKAFGVDDTVLEKHFGHDIDTAKQSYLQNDTYTFKEKDSMRDIIGDLPERLKGIKD